MAYQSFEDLEVWQRGCRLSVIAEGSERGSTKDFAHFLNFSKRSCGELRTQIYIARKLKLLGKSNFEHVVTETKEISKMLQGCVAPFWRKADRNRSALAAETYLKLNT